MLGRRLAVATGVVALLGWFLPAGAADPDPLYPLLQPTDLLTGPLAPNNGFAMDEYANRWFLPDWNHNGTFGDDGDVAIEASGAQAIGAFRYPCIELDGVVTFVAALGGTPPNDCTP